MQPHLIRRRSLKRAIPFLAIFVAPICPTGCHPLGDCSTPVTITPDAQYRITITEELRWDTDPPFSLLLREGDTFVVEGREPAEMPDGCPVGRLNPWVLPAQFADLEQCASVAVKGITCKLMPPAGCGDSIKLQIDGTFPRVETNESTQVLIYIQGSNCDGHYGRNKYNATAAWIGFKASGDGGIDG